MIVDADGFMDSLLDIPVKRTIIAADAVTLSEVSWSWYEVSKTNIVITHYVLIYITQLPKLIATGIV